MIRIEEISITEFRGIRNLTLKLGGKNFAISGPNGTGKSGIVDAIEFGLTGSVSRLSGKGTGGISVKEHGPHVDYRNKPDDARVVLKISISTLGQTVTIDRTVKNAKTPTITPQSAEITAILDNVAEHPEFVLSRRELIDYVLAAPGDRAREIQALLRLERVESLRTNLQRIANAAQKAVEPAKRERTSAVESLLSALQIPQLSQEKLLEAANARRTMLGLPAIAALTATTSLRDGLDSSHEKPAEQPISKKQALIDLQTARELIARIQDDSIKGQHAEITANLSALQSDPLVAAGVTREKLLADALAQAEEDTCPVCDTPWELEKLKEHIRGKLAELEEVAKKREAIQRKMSPLLEAAQRIDDALQRCEYHAKAGTPPLTVVSSEAFRLECRQRFEVIDRFVSLAETSSALEGLVVVPAKVVAELDAIEAAVKSIPNPTDADAARDYLTIAQERLERVRHAGMRLKKAEADATLADKVFEVYGSVATKALEGLYKQVEADFTEFYRFLNEEDEGSFSARLVPSIGKLGFDVDFYGRGYFPPGAYHSEGHQDGMGVCLYLALMKHVLESGFTLAVLDDVLMSVDAGHRRKVCALLKAHFPHTQFILTTHDDVWHRHMRTEGLIGNDGFARFRKWSVDEGPTEWDDRDVWAEIDGALGKHNIREAAGLLRHYLEYVSAEICHRLRAPVAFRGDGLHQLGDLLPSAVGQFRSLLKEGKAAEQSWGKTEAHDAIDVREKKVAEAAAKTLIEQWQTNPAVHYNAWANLQKEDFAPVVESYRALLALMFCPDCAGCYSVSPDRGPREGLRCTCGTTNINLKKKKGKG